MIVNESQLYNSSKIINKKFLTNEYDKVAFIFTIIIIFLFLNST